MLATALTACATPGHEEGSGASPGTGGHATTTGGGTGTGTSTGTGTATGTASEAYPAGPYGLQMGDTMADFAFMGYRDATGPYTQIQLSDYYDPDGTRGIRALYVTLGEVLCGACVGEAPHINDWKTQWGPYGTQFLSALWGGGAEVGNNAWTGGPATQATLDGWIAQYKITYTMVIDPTFQLGGGTEPQSNPNGYLVDPRTMKIVQYYMGAPGSLWGLTPLLQQNGATGL
jgi:hypothetical protein